MYIIKSKLLSQKGCTKEDGESSVGGEKQVSLQIQQSEVSWEEIIQGHNQNGEQTWPSGYHSVNKCVIKSVNLLINYIHDFHYFFIIIYPIFIHI